MPEFPLASVAVNVMVVVPTGKVDPLGKPAVCVSETPGQLSFATGGTQLTTALHKPGFDGTVMLAGHEVKTGS
jgi:hypothetical protein